MLEAVLTGPAIDVVGLASSGEDAVKVATSIVPDAAVVDYMMPGIDGFETATRIKAVHPDCQVVVFSALDIEAEANAPPHVDRFLRKVDVLHLEEVLGQLQTGRRSST